MKNRRILYRPLILIAFVLSTQSCSDKFFTEQAGDRITPNEHYKSVIDADISLKGALVPLQEIMPKMIMLDGLRTDQMDITDKTTPDLNAIYEQDLNIGNPYLDFSGFYKIIISANEILAHIDEVAKNDPKMDSVTLRNAKGSLIGLRSWSYFTLLRLYNSVAWIPDNMAGIPDHQVMLTKEDLLDTLVSQLRPYIYDTRVKQAYSELFVQDYPNLKEILGEVYLEQSNYDSAAVFLKMACESYVNAVRIDETTFKNNTKVIFKVDKSYTQKAWATIFNVADNNTIENFMVAPFSETEGQPNPLAQWMGYRDKYLVKPSQVLVDSFNAQIQSGGLLSTDIYRGNGVTFGVDSLNNNATYINKYSLETSDLYGADIIITRAAGVHLLLAEALNRSSDPAGTDYALLLLNLGFQKFPGGKPPKEWTNWSNNLGVRNRANVNPKLIPASVTDPAEIKNMVEDFIMDEQNLELAFEGHRFFDLARVAKRRNDPGYLANRIAEKYTDPGLKAAVISKLMDENNWYLPK